MALTKFQREICHLIADSRKKLGVSYIAGGVTLNAATNSTRISKDIDIFNDTKEALIAGWEYDYNTLINNGYEIKIVRERPFFIEVIVSNKIDFVEIQWTCDSAFRFFPLIEHQDFGLTLHPLDLATNKALALVGRLEVRDWIDIIAAHEKIQHLGLLLCAACGKDPGFSPLTILNEAKRSSRYTQSEIDSLNFKNSIPDVTSLAKQWKKMLKEAEQIIEFFPYEKVGECILNKNGSLLNGSMKNIIQQIIDNKINFHKGTICGAYPKIINSNKSSF